MDAPKPVKSMADEWAALHPKLYPGAPASMLYELEICFYAGATLALTSIMSTGDMTMEVAFKRLDKLKDELHAYGAKMIRAGMVCRGESCPRLGDSEFPPCDQCPRRNVQ